MRKIFAALICGAMLITTPAGAETRAADAEAEVTDPLSQADPALSAGSAAVSWATTEAHRTAAHEATGDAVPRFALLEAVREDSIDSAVGTAVGDPDVDVSEENLGPDPGDAGLVSCTMYPYKPTYYRRYRHVQGYGEMKCSSNISGAFRVDLQRRRWWGWEKSGQ